MPVFVATSKVLDLLSLQDATLAAKYRLSVIRYADRLAATLQTFGRTRLWADDPESVRPRLSRDLCYVQQNKAAIFGVAGVKGINATSFHELTVFEQLACHGVVSVCYPIGRLMKTPTEAPRTWESTLSVYPRLADYAAGFHKSHAWIASVLTAVQSLHRAGVVHVDLFPSNIMTKFLPGGKHSIKLIDFEPSLRIGFDVVPVNAPRLINFNGFTPMYHPGFQVGAAATIKFDLWFIAAFQLQVDDQHFDAAWWACSPTTDHQPLKKWFEEHRDAILSLVDVLELNMSALAVHDL
eukprot:m.30156 g.30156  ORF g.30156 m.30156 type:complete len:295 (-) comp4752_c0_seq2:94-978(-)